MKHFPCGLPVLFFCQRQIQSLCGVKGVGCPTVFRYDLVFVMSLDLSHASNLHCDVNTFNKQVTLSTFSKLLRQPPKLIHQPLVALRKAIGALI